MKISGYLLYCFCCDDLLRWSGERVSKLRCSCGESGGSHIVCEIADNLPLYHKFFIWGSATPIRIGTNTLSDKAHSSHCGETPFIGHEFFAKIAVPTSKSEDVNIDSYDDEDEFDLGVANELDFDEA